MGEEEGMLETLPSDEARWGRLTLLLPPDKALPMGTGTGTKGDAILAAAPPTRIATKIHTWGCERCSVKPMIAT